MARSGACWTERELLPISGVVEVLAHAQVAQLVEHRTENAGVGGSNPPLGTTLNLKLLFLNIYSRICVTF